MCKPQNDSRGPYVRFVLALFKKKYSTKIKEKPEELLRPAADYSEIISEVQRNTWVHTVESKTMLPSQDCLLLREKNISFQLQIWTQATSAIIHVPKPEQYGWSKTESGYHLQPDSAANLAKQKSIYDTIMQKCGCKSSQCLTLRCGCKKNGGYCSSLCQCTNCENTEHSKKNQSEGMNEPDLFMEENDELNTTSGSESESEEAVQSDVDMEDDI